MFAYVIFTFFITGNISMVGAMERPVALSLPDATKTTFLTSDKQVLQLSPEQIDCCAKLQSLMHDIPECTVDTAPYILPFDSQTGIHIHRILTKITSARTTNHQLTNYVFNQKFSDIQLFKVFTAADYLYCFPLLSACAVVFASRTLKRLSEESKKADFQIGVEKTCQWLDSIPLPKNLSELMGSEILRQIIRRVPPYSITDHPHTGVITSLCFSPDQRQLASAGTDATVRVYNIQNGYNHGTCLNILRGHTQKIRSVCYVGPQIISGSQDESIRVWDVRGTCLETLEGHTDAVTGVVSLSSNQVASSSLDKTVRLWNIEHGYCSRTMKGKNPILSFDCTTGGAECAAFANNDTVHIWDLRNKLPVQTLQTQEDDILALRYSPDETQLALASNKPNAHISLWDLKKNTCIQQLPYMKEINSFDYSPEGMYLGLALQDKTMVLHSLENNQSTMVPLQYDASVVAYAPKSNLCALAGHTTLELLNFTPYHEGSEEKFTAQTAVALYYAEQLMNTMPEYITIDDPMSKRVVPERLHKYLIYLRDHTGL